MTPGERAIHDYKITVTPDPSWICRVCGTSTTETWYICPRCERARQDEAPQVIR